MILHALRKNHFKKKYLGCQDCCSPELSERFSNSTTIWIWVKNLQEKEQFGVQFLQVFWECEGQPWSNHYVILFFNSFSIQWFLLQLKLCRKVSVMMQNMYWPIFVFNYSHFKSFVWIKMDSHWHFEYLSTVLLNNIRKVILFKLCRSLISNTTT